MSSDLGNQLGEGKFSHVYQCLSNPAYVIKKIDKSKTTLDRFNEEVGNLKLCSNVEEGIVKIINSYSEDKYYYIVLLKFDGISLESFLWSSDKNHHDPLVLKTVFRNLLAAVGNLHECKIVHNDLKPTNVLIDPDTKRICLVDLGLSTKLGKTKMINGSMGTNEFMAPEKFIRGSLYDGVKADIWSVGIIMYGYYLGVLPFTPEYRKWYIRRFKRHPLLPATAEFHKLDLKLKSLLLGMLSIKANVRYTIDEALSSSWLNNTEEMEVEMNKLT